LWRWGDSGADGGELELTLERSYVMQSEFSNLIEKLLEYSQEIPREHIEKLNERYLHHWLSGQKDQIFRGASLEPSAPLDKIEFHPEWPTAKSSVGIKFACYSAEAPKPIRVTYKKPSGSAHLDFAIGNIASPRLAIELKFSKNIIYKELEFDFLKMLDPRLPMGLRLSFALVSRDGGKSRNRENFKKIRNRAVNSHKAFDSKPGTSEFKTVLLVCELRNGQTQCWWNVDQWTKENGYSTITEAVGTVEEAKAALKNIG
jgi:hypothetical protein